MKVLIQHIVPHFVEYDLIQAQAKKVMDISIVIEHFDFRKGHPYEFQPYTLIPKQLKAVFCELYDLSRKNKTLDSQGYNLMLKEERDSCEMILTNEIDDKPRIVNFSKTKWADVEEILLESGLDLVYRHEEYRLLYIHEATQTRFDLAILPERYSYMYVESNDEDTLKKALALIHYRIEQTVPVSSE